MISEAARRVALRFASRRNVLVSELAGNRVWTAVVQIGDKLYLEQLQPARGLIAVLDRREVWLPEGMTAEETLYRNAWGRKGAPEIIEYDIDADAAELRKLRSQYRRKKR